MRKLLLLALLVLSTLSLTACVSLAEDVTPPPGYQAPTAVQSTAQPSGPVYPIVAPDPVKGEALYVTECAPCHGDSGLGDGSEAD
ncbi:MAG: hypothetical protein JW862_14280, partial [Anaerolineales bacterium]|nr:hypothetical protein [Anaerolineales bacterium]